MQRVQRDIDLEDSPPRRLADHRLRRGRGVGAARARVDLRHEPDREQAEQPGRAERPPVAAEPRAGRPRAPGGDRGAGMCAAKIQPKTTPTLSRPKISAVAPPSAAPSRPSRARRRRRTGSARSAATPNTYGSASRLRPRSAVVPGEEQPRVVAVGQPARAAFRRGRRRRSSRAATRRPPRRSRGPSRPGSGASRSGRSSTRRR